MRWFAKARNTDPSTSYEAAKSVTAISETQTRILFLLKEYGPQNDEQLATSYDYHATKGGWSLVSDSGLRSRRAELVGLGLVKDSGERIKMRSGRNSIVWKAN